MQLRSIDPTSGETFAEHLEHTREECDEILKDCDEAFGTWSAMSFDKRGACFNRLAEWLRQQEDQLAGLIAREMGKPIKDARTEVNKCADTCEYFARAAEGFLRDEPIETEGQKSYVTYQPLGVILGIMPWNFPIWQVIRYSAPVMMAGNTTVLKHANNVTGCALAVEELFRKAGFPENAFRALVIDIPEVDRIIRHPLVAGVTLTGSPRAGKAVAGAAGEELKKCVLELGGSDPFVVLEDADIDAAIEAGVKSRLAVSGQVCISPKRFIVPDALRETFESKLVDAVRAAKMGNPMEEDTVYGPLARPDLRDTVARQVDESVAKGAKKLLDSEIPDGPGAFYPATVLTNIAPGMPAYDEEIFGPVAAVISVSSDEEALRVANDTPYGLGAVVFSRDVKRAERMARNIEAGCCFVNAAVRSDPRMPFGGIKQSGFGRELGAHGIREFTNTKTVYVA